MRDRGRVLLDDLGTEVPVAAGASRIVSLVPSLTESIASIDQSLLVGATDWCTYPAGLDVTRVRGTKNPDVRRIRALEPDLVVANMEENRELDVRRLRDAGVPVWVTRIETVPEALDSISRLVERALGRQVPEWLSQARELWSAPAPSLGIRVAVPVWRDPWFMVGPRTFADDLITRCGLVNAFGAGEAGQDLPGDAPRYPKVGVEAISANGVDVVLLPDEPYEFSAADGPEAMRVPTALIPGRSLTWYGPTLLTAREAILGPTLRALGRQG